MSIPFGGQPLSEVKSAENEHVASDTSSSLLDCLCDVSCRVGMTDSLLLLCMAVESQVESAALNESNQTMPMSTHTSHETQESPELHPLTTAFELYCVKYGPPRSIVHTLLQSKNWNYRQTLHQQPILYHLLGKDAQNQGDLAYHVFFLLQELIQGDYKLFTYQADQGVYTLAKLELKMTMGRLKIYLLIGTLLYAASSYRHHLPVSFAPSLWQSLQVDFSPNEFHERLASAGDWTRIQAEFARFSVKMSLEDPIWMIRYPFLTNMHTMTMLGSDQSIFPSSPQHLISIMQRQQQQQHKQVHRVSL